MLLLLSKSQKVPPHLAARLAASQSSHVVTVHMSPSPPRQLALPSKLRGTARHAMYLVDCGLDKKATRRYKKQECSVKNTESLRRI